VIIYPIIASLLALLTVAYLTKDVLSKDGGNEKMIEISRLVQEGAAAFLKREYQYIGIFILILTILISIAPGLGLPTAGAFIAGAVASGSAGFIGMSIATRANCRTTQAAKESGLKGALAVAVSGGAVMGLSVVGLALLGLCIVYILAKGDTEIVNGYAMGASLVALFARCGGGIYTKGADMGADLVGKVEAGIPEDDPRNPAVIADNVGDNVGDVAGLGADLLESFIESIIAAVAIFSAVALAIPVTTPEMASSIEVFKMIPMLIATLGIVSSIIGIFYIKLVGAQNPQKALMTGTYLAAFLTIVGTFFMLYYFRAQLELPALKTALNLAGFQYSWIGIFGASIIGVIAGIVIGYVSEYYTSSDYKPVKKLAENSQSGPAITVTEGIAIGMQSTAVPVIVLAIALILGFQWAGFFGVALSAVGMLATTGIVVTVDSYGPIADNAGGIAEMAELDPSVRKITDNLDSVGNTTAAVGKGFAIGSAAFAAVGLVSAYLTTLQLTGAAVSLNDTRVLSGLLLGGMLPFLFSSWLFRAVGNAAYSMIEEVRRQFKEIPGLLEGKAKPDPKTCVDISTKGAIKGMILPGLMAIIVPVAIGILLGPATLAGVLIGSLVTGLMLGIQTANSGGAMDNAKKYIEEGHFGGKGSEAHKAAVVGDTVGDPLKDTVGPSINILIKLMAVISLVLAPLLKTIEPLF
jgi:K(+)-stimulated pyrophosphate-energized sodium pump